MFLCEKRFYCSLLVFCIFLGEAAIHYHPPSPVLKEYTTFLTKVCPLMLYKSNHKLIHIINFSPKFDSTALIRTLHDTVTPTLQVTDIHAMSPQFTDTEPKTMLFIVDDLSSILNVILGSQHLGKVGAAASLENIEEMSKFLNGTQQPFSLPNFCIHHVGELNLSFMDPTRPCDENLYVSESHVRDHSILPDTLFNQVRGLHMSNVWNSRSYLIFYVLSTSQAPQISGENTLQGDELMYSIRFLFKAMWRFYRGQKTLICLKEVCFRYDPFFELIQIYEGENDDKFFDFSWYSMNGKKLSSSILDLRPFHFDAIVNDLCTVNSFIPIYQIMWMLVMRRGGDLEIKLIEESPESSPDKLMGNMHAHQYVSLLTISQDSQRDSNLENSPSNLSSHLDYLEYGMKFGVDLWIFAGGSVNLENLHGFEITPTLESCQLTVRLPRKGYVPQDVAPFYCFSPTLWIFVIITIFIFALANYLLSYAHTDIFRSTESEDATMDPGSLSTAMTIYMYILGIGLPRVTAIELMTGKIVFFVIVFSMMIFITLFQSGMFSLLSSQVRYEDIDTLKAIEESDLVVQSSDLGMDAQFLGNDSEFNWIRQRLTDGYQFKSDKKCLNLRSLDINANLSGMNYNIDERCLARAEIDTMLKSNAFLTRMSTKYTELKDLIYFDPVTESKYEFHIVQERLKSYPLTYFMQRNSFYTDTLNDKLFRLVESGFGSGIFGRVVVMDFKHFEEREDDEVLRPFTMTDLRLAFVCLAIGWVLSGFCFIMEVLWKF